MRNLFFQITTIYLAGATGIWKAIPVGFAIKAHPIIIALFTALGSISMILVIYFSGEKLKNWILSKYGTKNIEKKKQRFTNLKEKYGTIGLGLFGSGTIGPIPTIVIALIILNVNLKFIKYMIIGIIIWSVIITTLSAYFLDFLLRFL